MLWEGRPLRDIRDADARRLVESGLEEHLQLEYKSALYEDNDRGRREFLLDICMFANSSGGVLLIGVPERRDELGQPTGAPDPAAPIGLELPNPELVLGAYDARVTEAIEERLPLEMASIDVGEGRLLVAIRVPDSVRKRSTRAAALPIVGSGDQRADYENGKPVAAVRRDVTERVRSSRGRTGSAVSDHRNDSGLL